MKYLITSAILVASLHCWASVQPMTLRQAKALLTQPIPSEVQTVLQKTPTDYSFFTLQGESSVNYQGQVMRNLLITDQKGAFYSLAYSEQKNQASVAMDLLDSYYLYDSTKDGGSFIEMKLVNEQGVAQSAPWEGFEYSAVYPGSINLKSKMAGVDNPLRHGKMLGWNSEKLGGLLVDRDGDGTLVPVELFETMLEAVANNAAASQTHFMAPNGTLAEQKVEAAAVLPEGLDLAQLSQKFLHSAVSFSQATGDYLSDDLGEKGFNGDNTTLLPNRTYTDLQHSWDEAFGYFGAARNYLEYSDTQILSEFSLDAYTSEEVIDPSNGSVLYIDALVGGDFEYSISSEKNMGLSVNAAKRDAGAISGKEDFTLKTMSAFLKGRQLVQERPNGYLPYAQAHAVLALHEWERVIAASVIHYINELSGDLQSYGTEDFNFVDMAKHFSEMKGFAFAFQFNPRSVMSVQDFAKLHQQLGDRPVDLQKGDLSQYLQDLKSARDLLVKTYEFSSQDGENW